MSSVYQITKLRLVSLIEDSCRVCRMKDINLDALWKTRSEGRGKLVKHDGLTVTYTGV